MAKQKKHTLSFDESPEYQLLGLCSHHRDYRLAWSINEAMDMHFVKSENDFALYKKGEISSLHPMYECRDEEAFAEYFLIKNKHEGHFLIPEKPIIDYFLFICENDQFDPAPFIESLKNLNSVLGVYEFDPALIKSTENIIFD